MATILTITANPLLDHIASGRLQEHAVVRVPGFAPVAGGKGLNVGRVLARHGHQVIACGFVGGAEGDQIADLATAAGLHCAFTRVAARSRIGFTTVDATGGGVSSVIEDGFAVTAQEMGRLVQEVRERLAGADLVLIGGSVPNPACSSLYRVILDACAQAGVTAWVDSYGPAMDEALSGSHPPALGKPNRGEYGRGRKWLPCRELHLTAGAGEIRVRTPEGRFSVAPPRIAEVNAIGSGDCYLAALAHARLTGASLPDQLRYAAAAGAANAIRADIACIAPADISALCDQVTITPLEG